MISTVDLHNSQAMAAMEDLSRQALSGATVHLAMGCSRPGTVHLKVDQATVGSNQAMGPRKIKAELSSENITSKLSELRLKCRPS